MWQNRNGAMPNTFAAFAHDFSHLSPGRGAHADCRYSVLGGKDLLEYNVEQQAGDDATLRNFRANPSYPRK